MGSKPKFNRKSINFKNLTSLQDFGLLFVILFGGVILSFASDVFATGLNFRNVALASTVVAVMAIGQTFVILVAGIDLSVGAMLALSSVLSVGFTIKQGLPVGVSIVLALLVGLFVGLINGLSVTLLNIPPLIATLASMSIVRGFAYIYSGGMNITPTPDIFSQFQEATVFGMPLVIIFTLVLGIIAHITLTKTSFGRQVFSTGGNALASKLAGIRVNRVIIYCYMISGFSAALAGILLSARLDAGAATAGMGYELTVISACVIGGVSLFGGEGKIGAVFLGVLLLALVQNAINLLEVPANYDYVVSGLVIAAAASLDVYRRGLVDAGLKRSNSAQKVESPEEK